MSRTNKSFERFKELVYRSPGAQERVNAMVEELRSEVAKWRSFTCTQCGVTVQLTPAIAEGRPLRLEAWCTGGTRPHRSVMMVEVNEEEEE